MRPLRRLLYRLLWTTVERPQAYRMGNVVYVSPKTAAALRAQIAPAQSAFGLLPKVGDFEIVESPYVAQYVTEPRFPRLAALWRRFA